jgi:hypothetical protein
VHTRVALNYHIRPEGAVSVRIEVEAKQRVAQARAEAESLSIQRQQVTAELIRLREMENQRIAIEKWDGKLPNMSGGAVPFINVK